jgi:Chaperone of endosialidase
MRPFFQKIAPKLLLIGLFIITIAVVTFSQPASPAKAATNMVMNYQGKLTNTSNVAVADGTYNMEFKLYDTVGTGNPPTGGTLLWTETRTGANKVQVTNGIFSVMLGEVTSLSSVNFNQTLFLSVNIGGTGTPSWDQEMFPRKKIGTVPAAFLANSLEGTGKIDITNTGTQASLAYDASNKLTIGVASTGFTTITSVGTATGFNLTGGNVGIGSSTVSAKLHVTATTEQLRVGYDASNYTSFTTSSGGDLTLAPSGNDLGVTGNVDVSGSLTAGTANSFNVDTSGNITAGNYQGSIIASNYGGTGNGFTKFSGPTTSEKIFTLPNASATILTSNTAVTPAQGGTGVNNGSNTLTLAGNLVTTGAFNTTLATSATTTLTLPGVSGTIATLAGTEVFTNKTIGNTNTVIHKDTLFTVQDDGDTTKQLQLQLSGLTTATTRTLTIQDASGTLALTSNKLSAFAATTSAELATNISDETGSGLLVYGTSPVLTTPNLGTPSAVTLTNGTGLPLAGITGFGTGVSTFLGTPSSANLITAVTDETGSGLLVFSTSPVLTTPNLGTPSAGVLTNATGLPLTTGVTGTLAVGNGGIGVNTLASNGVLYGNATGAVQALAVNAGATLCLTQASSAAPAWGSCGAGGATAFDTIGDPTGAGAIAMGATVQTLDWGSITSTTGLSVTGGSAMTSGTLFKVGAATFTHTGTETGNLANLIFTDATTAVVTATTNGLKISPTISAASGAATRTINGLSVEPAFTACTTGTCAVNGLNVGNVVDGTGFTGTGLKVGTGWDYAATFLSGSVGIGTATPAETLQISDTAGAGGNKNIKLTTTFSGTNDEINLYFDDPSKPMGWAIGRTGWCTFANTAFAIIEDDTCATRMIFGAGGNVGIGIGNNNPTTQFSVGAGEPFKISSTGNTIVSTTTNSTTAFQVQNSAGAPILLVDTTSTDATAAQVNYLTYPGFESGSFSSASTGWIQSGGSTLTQNTNKIHTFNGLYSAQVVSSAASQGLNTTAFVSAPPGAPTTYIVSFYAKISTGTIASTAFTASTTGGVGSCSPAAGVTINALGFQRLYCSVTVTGAITGLTIIQTAGANTIYYDGVQLQKNSYNGFAITAPSTYQIGALQLRGVITNPLALQNNGDSTTSFSISNGAGLNVLNVDTMNHNMSLTSYLAFGTLMNITNNTASNTGTLLALSGTGLTSGNGLTITGGTTTTGNLLGVTSTSTSAPTNGLVRFNFNGARTTAGNGFVIDDISTTLATVMKVNGNSLTTGNGLVISATATGLTGNALSVTTGSTSTVTAGLVRFNFGGARTTAGNGLQIDDASTALATAVKLNLTATNSTTTLGLAITSPSTALTTAGANVGSLLDITESGAMTAMSGQLVNINASGANAVGATGSALNINIAGTAQLMHGLTINDATTGNLGTTFGTSGALVVNMTGNHTGYAATMKDVTTAGTVLAINDTGVMTAGGGIFVNLSGITAAGSTTSAAGVAIQMSPTATQVGERFMRFLNSSGVEMGSINNTSATVIAYATSSDGRLKGDQTQTHYTIDDLMKIEVKDFTWNSSGQRDTGFIAQQLYTVFPGAVTKGDNGIDPLIPGVTNTWSVDYGKVTPIIIKAIQDQQGLIVGLKARLDLAEQNISQLQINASSLGSLSVPHSDPSPGLSAGPNSIDEITLFKKDITFLGRPYFNNDTAGFAIIQAGDRKVTISFTDEYLAQPVINVGATMNAKAALKDETDPVKIQAMQSAAESAAQELFDAGIQYLVIDKNEKGFTLLLNKPAPKDIGFSWIALAVKDPKIVISRGPDTVTTPINVPVDDSGVVAGDNDPETEPTPAENSQAESSGSVSASSSEQSADQVTQ